MKKIFSYIETKNAVFQRFSRWHANCKISICISKYKMEVKINQLMKKNYGNIKKWEVFILTLIV